MRASDRRDWMLILAAMALALAFCSPALAQPKCGPRDRIEKTITTAYGEIRTWVLVDSSGALITLWLNPDTGSWTQTRREAGKDAVCLVGSGKGYAFPGVTPPGEPL